MGTMEGVAHVPASSQRVRAGYDALTELATPLIVPPSSRRYNLQFSSLYDYRLRRLKHPKGRLLAAATRRWTEGIYDEADDDLKVDAIDSQTNEEDQASTSCVAGRTVTTTSRKRGRREERLPKANYVKRILDVKQGQICFVIGTIYCSMHLKPDVLEELTREQWLPPQPASERYADPERDDFYIEDESGRVRLVGDALAPDGYLRSSLVTGVVVAILGTETRSGDFEVADAIFAGVPSETDAAAANGSVVTKDEESMDVDADGNEGWVAVVSGLEIEPARSSIQAESNTVNGKVTVEGGADEQMLGYAARELRLMMLTDWLLGMAGDDQTSSRICSLVIAGNSVAPLGKMDEDRATGPRSGPSGPPASKNAYPTSSLDDFLADLTASMHVHILPGERDPTSMAMPQQPIHFALLPKSAQYCGLHRETNPAWFGVGGKRFLGSSGQNIDDIFKYMVETDQDARLDAACHTLDWSHVAPTAPDTLTCYPLNDRDPFLIEAAPDVYFIGNQDRFATRLYRSSDGHQIRVVLVPQFSLTGCVVLVNPKTLACKLVEVGGPAFVDA